MISKGRGQVCATIEPTVRAMVAILFCEITMAERKGASGPVFSSFPRFPSTAWRPLTARLNGEIHTLTTMTQPTADNWQARAEVAGAKETREPGQPDTFAEYVAALVMANRTAYSPKSASMVRSDHEPMASCSRTRNGLQP